MALSQEDYMRANVGDDDKMWKPLPGFFTPGTPLYNEEGGDILKGPRNIDAAKKLLAQSGYSGQPITCLVAQDIPYLKAWGEVTADLLKRLGMKVDFVATDWGTVIGTPVAEIAAWPGRLAHLPLMECRRFGHQPRCLPPAPREWRECISRMAQQSSSRGRDRGLVRRQDARRGKDRRAPAEQGRA
jgi:hypothetical protein